MNKDFEEIPGGGVVVDIVRADTLQLEQTRWLWWYWLPSGELVIVAGAPGMAKTTIVLNLAATVTTGGPDGSRWPDGSRCLKPHNVVIWSGEDSVERTLLPRLKAAGADLKRVHIVRSVVDDGGKRAFDPAFDFDALAARAREIGDVGLLMIDPVVVAVRGDSHKNAETRRGLQPLVEFAREIDAAVVGVTHFTKGTAGNDPLERVTGSLAFGAIGRLVLAAARMPDEGDGQPVHVLARVKSNLGPSGDAYTYTTPIAALQEPVGDIEAVRIQWGELVKGNAREILAAAEQTEDEDEEEGSALGEAREFLLEVLKDGARLEARAVYREARDAGHSERTVRRAQRILGIRPERDGHARKWYWRLSEQHGQQSPPQKHGHLGHLEQDGQDGHEIGVGGVGHLAPAECPRCRGEGCRWCQGTA